MLLSVSPFLKLEGPYESFCVRVKEPYAPLKEETTTDFSGLLLCCSAGPLPVGFQNTWHMRKRKVSEEARHETLVYGPKEPFG